MHRRRRCASCARRRARNIRAGRQKKTDERSSRAWKSSSGGPSGDASPEELNRSELFSRSYDGSNEISGADHAADGRDADR